MKVSIVILNYFHPEIIDVCLHTLDITEGVDYEVIVVDNGSTEEGHAQLVQFRDEGLITKLVKPEKNLLFSAGNNLGVSHADPESEYILLLNSDIGFIRPDWLKKQIAWMEGTIQYQPSVWNLHPTIPKGGMLDIVSIGWSHDATVLPGNARPEGWCLMIRKCLWRDMSEDFPWLYGMDEMLTNIIRDTGARCGVLSQYSPYLTHAEGSSGREHVAAAIGPEKRPSNIAGWYNGLEIETLDFTLGSNEHQSYLSW